MRKTDPEEGKEDTFTVYLDPVLNPKWAWPKPEGSIFDRTWKTYFLTYLTVIMILQNNTVLFKKWDTNDMYIKCKC